MEHSLSFLWIAAAASATVAVMFGIPCPGSLARNKWIGIALSILMLILLIPHVVQLFPADSARTLAMPLRIVACVVAILLWMYADYLFARALAVACIYLSWLALQGGYAISIHPLYSVLFILIGIAGILLGAKPFWLRDLLELAQKSARIRWGVCGGWGIAAVMFLWRALQ